MNPPFDGFTGIDDRARRLVAITQLPARRLRLLDRGDSEDVEEFI